MDAALPALLVIGHKNPDTDSVCSAIAYAAFKSAVAGEPAQAFRAGNINGQTRFVLARFGVASPPLLTDVYPRVSDIMIPRAECLTVGPDSPLEAAAEMITARGFSFVPVVDRDDRCRGRVTAVRLVGLLRTVAGRSCDGPPGEAAAALLAAPIGGLVEDEYAVFRPGDLVRDARRQAAQRSEGGFVVVGEDGKLQGVLTRRSFLRENRSRVILVDHNEPAQSVDGVEEADVVEIIDHHRLGNRTTRAPITFINRTVGSTATIVADIYAAAGAAPPPSHAGILLSALLSDTMILRSPTTTPADRAAAERLSRICGEDAESLGRALFAAGAGLEGRQPSEVVRQDRKKYDEAGHRFSVSQAESVGFGPVLDARAGLLAELERVREAEELSLACLMVTDVTREGSLLLAVGAPRILGMISYPRRAEGAWEMAGVLSRKKQALPWLIDLLSRV
jgi:manganese-dependent inorganic pyrophosphatase